MATGASALHEFGLSVRSDGSVAVTGTRYDFAKSGFAPISAAGVQVSNHLTRPSRLGEPLRLETNSLVVTNNYVTLSDRVQQLMFFTNSVVTKRCPFVVFLNDGMVLRGDVRVVVGSFQGWDETLFRRTSQSTTNGLAFNGMVSSYGGGYGTAFDRTQTYFVSPAP